MEVTSPYAQVTYLYGRVTHLYARMRGVSPRQAGPPQRFRERKTPQGMIPDVLQRVRGGWGHETPDRVHPVGSCQRTGDVSTRNADRLEGEG